MIENTHKHYIYGLILLLVCGLSTNLACSPTENPQEKAIEQSTQDGSLSDAAGVDAQQDQGAQPDLGGQPDVTPVDKSSADSQPSQDNPSQDTTTPDATSDAAPQDLQVPDPGPADQRAPDTPPQPTPTGMPIGIPAPSFGLQETVQMYKGMPGYQTSPAGPYTHYVDNTHPKCDNNQTNGSPGKPLCDIFLDQSAKLKRALTLPAGSVVEIHGGPYKYDGWRRIVSQGTATKPVFFRGHDAKQRVRFTSTGNGHDLRIEGSYLIVENLEFYNKANIHTESQPQARPHHLAFRNLEIHNAKGTTVSFGSALSWTADDVVVSKCHIHDNVRLRNGSIFDLHGITIGASSRRAWILDNHVHHNSGDSFQACHRCLDYPRFVYIGRNTFHDDRENGVDLKTIHDVVVSENIIYNYKSSNTSSGDAVVIGSNGFDGKGIGPNNVWFIANIIRDSASGIRVEGAGTAHLIGNVINNIARAGIQVEKLFGAVSIVNNTITNTQTGLLFGFGCRTYKSLLVTNNIFFKNTTHHISLAGCVAKVTDVSHNLFWNSDGNAKVRLSDSGKAAYVGKSGKDLDVYLAKHYQSGSGNLIVDPQFVGGNLYELKPTSPALDKGKTSPSYSSFQSLYKLDIKLDLRHTRRPQSGQWDIGAFEAK